MKANPSSSKAVVRQISDRMDELRYREEMMWLQRSRIAWLKEGGRNTSYFHRQAVRRARKNRIKKLKDSNGEWCENSKQMQRMASNFFKDLYTRSFTMVGKVPWYL